MKNAVSVCVRGLVAVLLGLALFAVLFFARPAVVRADDSVSGFTELPSNWELSELCDVDNVTVGAANGNLSIKSMSTATMSKYYGALVRIETDKTYGDFTFEISVRMSDPFDTSRWFGIMYHTQFADNGKLIGYMMNFRYSGESASSAVTPSLSYPDDARKASGVQLSDGLFHTITITLSGTTAAHYVDGKLITEWDVSTKDGNIGKSLESGGFALIVNRSTLTVKSVNISNEVKAPTPVERETDNSLAGTYNPTTGLVSPATVVTDVTSEDVLKNLTDEKGRAPSSVILHVDEKMNVVDAKGKSIGAFYDVYKSLGNKIIPVVYVNSKKAADAFVEFMHKKLYILDIAVMSKDAALVKSVRSNLIGIRGIVEYDRVKSLYSVVRESTDAGAMTVVLPQSSADSKSVAYLQARFKTVWVRANSSSLGDISDSLFGGAFGVIADYSAAYDVMENLSGFTRNIFNVAHRGLRKVYNENGLIGLEASMRAGATHVELDAMLTKDKEVVIMHDDNISRTTNGSGAVANMTLADLRKYVLKDKDSAAKERIPTLEEIIDTMKSLNDELGTDVVLILEIKADDTDLVPRIKEILDEKEFYESIVFITFDSSEHQLAPLRDNMPWVPASGLNDANVGNFAAQLGALNAAHAGVDPSKGNITPQFIKMMTDRGFTPWAWTFDEVGSSTNTTFDAVKLGLLGVTSDEADIYSGMVRYAYGDDVKDVSQKDVPAVGDTVLITLVCYNGEESIVPAEIYAVEKTPWGWQCFVSYTVEVKGEEKTAYSRAVNYYAPVSDDDGGNVGLIVALCVVGGVVVAGGAVALVIVLKKKNKKKGEAQ
ncbi:MAG: hypothetical protein J1G38_01520 [Clostridiales bacterium]|nr:hypothetical protein [Clostridiales bacterium]